MIPEDDITALRHIRSWLGARLRAMAGSSTIFTNEQIASLIGAIDLVDDVIAKWEKLAIVRPATTKGPDPTDHTVPSVDSSKLGNPCIANEWPILSVPTMGVSFSRGAGMVSCPWCGTIHQCPGGAWGPQGL